MATKAQVKAAYIKRLQAQYAFYIEGSRPLELANLAADSALNGVQHISGECWYGALKECGLRPTVTLKELAALSD